MPHRRHAEAFLQRLAEVLPAGYRAVIEDEILWLISPDGGAAGAGADWLTADVLLADEALVGSVQSLHQIQQEIAEETTEPWPPHWGEGSPGFPEPKAELVGDRLYLWFGDKAMPVLAFSPIDLRDVILRD